MLTFSLLFHLNDAITWSTVVFIDSLGLYFKCWTEGVIVKGSEMV